MKVMPSGCSGRLSRLSSSQGASAEPANRGMGESVLRDEVEDSVADPGVGDLVGFHPRGSGGRLQIYQGGPLVRGEAAEWA